MPAGGKPMLFDWIKRDDVQPPFSVFQSLLNRLDQARLVGFVDCGAILDCKNDPWQAPYFWLNIGTNHFAIQPDTQKALLV